MTTGNVSVLGVSRNGLLSQGWAPGAEFHAAVRASSLACILILVIYAASGVFGGPRTGRDVKALLLVATLFHGKAVFELLRKTLPHEAYIYAAVVFALQITYATGERKPVLPGADERACYDDRRRQSFLTLMMFPCRTTHTRLFPQTHSFSYSYLFVGVPIGRHGSGGNLLSSDFSSIRSAWFSVVAEDYLERRRHPDGLQGKLRDYLGNQQISPDDYPHAYLVTAPRFLGFSFNPVSFWYLYDRNGTFGAMILEVNNTFDERRMYLLRQTVDHNQSPDKKKFSHEWSKDFHVSPFNDREGSYSLTATDPFHNTTEGAAKVDNNIVLKAPDGKAKLIARVFSTGPGLPASKFSPWHTAAFIARWWWVGFMTNPRILREARVLWVKKLTLFYRPEVFTTSIGRSETAEETKLEPYSRRYLQTLADTSGRAFTLIPAAGPDRGRRIRIQASAVVESTPHQEPLEIKILTPSFYAELVRHADLNRAWQRLCFSAAPGEAMVHTSDPSTLQQILESNTAVSTVETADMTATQRFNHDLRAGSALRTATATVLLYSKLPSSSPTEAHHRPTPHKSTSFADIIRSSSSPQEIRVFDKLSLIVLVADRLALGWPSILKLYAWVAWAVLIYITASALGDGIVAGYYSYSHASFLRLGLGGLGLAVVNAVIHAVRADGCER